jgi:hypothetical protein
MFVKTKVSQVIYTGFHPLKVPQHCESTYLSFMAVVYLFVFNVGARRVT